MDASGRYRRVLVVAARSDEGPLTKPIAAAQAWWRELVFMPSFGPVGRRHLERNPLKFERSLSLRRSLHIRRVGRDRGVCRYAARGCRSNAPGLCADGL